MKPPKRILVIGGTGMLGRPVVRRLRQEGFVVGVFTRNPQKAKRWFPSSVEIHAGELENIASLKNAIDQYDAVYFNSFTTNRKGFRQETDGLKNILASNPKQKPILMISGYGVHHHSFDKKNWWHLNEKIEAQRMITTSQVPYVIFEPTWFMESLPLFIQKGIAIIFNHPITLAPHWIAGDDYGKIVASVLNDLSRYQNQIIPVLGPRAMNLKEALRAFISAYDRSIKTLSIPKTIFMILAHLHPQVREFDRLVRYYASLQESESIPAGLPLPSMTVEDYARYVRQTGDFPQK